MKAIILATGPSLTKQQLLAAIKLQEKGYSLFGMNHLWKEDIPLDYFLSCDPKYYALYWEQGLKDNPAIKYTWDETTAEKYGISLVSGEWGEGFSTKFNTIHYGHSSGFQLPGLAYTLGYRELLLLGYDMKYAPDYDGVKRKAGSRPRHYFGEYSQELQHWPSTEIENGIFTGLITQFEKVKEINTDVEIINCTPDSAMKCFPMANIEDFL